MSDAPDAPEDPIAEQPPADEPAAAAEEAPADAWDDDGLDGFDDEDDTWGDGGDEDEDRKKKVLMAQIGLVVLVLVIVAIVLVSKSNKDDDNSSSNGNTKTTQTTPDGKPTTAKPAWPRWIEGRPKTLGKRGQTATQVTPKGAKPGVYVWSDYDGWHMWVVPGEGIPSTVKGSLTSNDEFSKASASVPDTGTAKVNGKVVDFSLDTNKPVVGMEWNTGFYANRLVLEVNDPDGNPLPTNLIRTGAAAQGAKSYPLVIDKAVQPQN